MAANTEIPQDLISVRVFIRFLLRIIILSFFAALGHQGFGRTFTNLLVLAIFYCIVAAAIRHEEVMGSVLTHYDEAAAYGVAAGIASWLS